MMRSYLDHLERLNYAYPLAVAGSVILNSLSKGFEEFVRNYNMHNMGKTKAEIHAMLIEFEKNLPKKSVEPQLHVISSGGIQKKKKKRDPASLPNPESCCLSV